MLLRFASHMHVLAVYSLLLLSLYFRSHLTPPCIMKPAVCLYVPCA